MKPRFFASQEAFRGWLEKHHATEAELFVGFYKKASGKGGLDHKAAIDELLCFGWIDGVVRALDADSYMHRFTPRIATSHWSNINVKRYQELDAAGLVTAAGKAAYARRTDKRTGQMSFEQPPTEFSAAQKKTFVRNAKAWKFFEEQPAGYKRQVKFWVTQAKQEATRERRLAALIGCCDRGERVPHLIPPSLRKG